MTSPILPCFYVVVQHRETISGPQEIYQQELLVGSHGGSYDVFKVCLVAIEKLGVGLKSDKKKSCESHV